tara:strand:- start:235 stop:483 length:249 start_codon:yes stop_codon:yes gene_type:complete
MIKSDTGADAAVAGISALSLVEALLLQLMEKGVLSGDEVDEAFYAAIDAHQTAYCDYGDIINKRVAEKLKILMVNGNSVKLK